MIVQKELRILVFVVVSLVCINGVEGATEIECYWDADTENGDFPVNPPMILDKNDNIIPLEKIDGKRILKVPALTELQIACPGLMYDLVDTDEIIQNYFTNFPPVLFFTAKCNEGRSLSLFYDDGNLIGHYTMKSMGCQVPVSASTRHFEGMCQDWKENNIGDYHEIGFWLHQNKFIQQISSCFDGNTQRTLRTEHTVRGEYLEARDTSTINSNFLTDEVFTSSMDGIYHPANSQQELFENNLGLESTNKVFDQDTAVQWYLSKGHMAPDGDFVWLTERRATYSYLNVFPQWMIVNAGNWLRLEFDIRDLAKKHRRDFGIITGGHGILKLRNDGGDYVEMYLAEYAKTDPGKHVPAPFLIWKIVYDPSFKKAVAIITANNHLPVEENGPNIANICTDICDQITWLDMLCNEEKRKDYNYGYTYCCEYHEFKMHAQNVPPLYVTGLLTS